MYYYQYQRHLFDGTYEAIPRDWTVPQTYFAITMVLATVGWADWQELYVKLLALREEDYILAAQIAGVVKSKVITTHPIPNFSVI